MCGTVLTERDRAQKCDPAYPGLCAFELTQPFFPLTCPVACVWSRGPRVLPAPFLPHLLLETPPYQFISFISFLGSYSVP